MQSHLEPHQHTRPSSISTAEGNTDAKSQCLQARSKSVSVNSPTDVASAFRHPQKQNSKLTPPLQVKLQALSPTPPKNRETASLSEFDSSIREDTKLKAFTVYEVVEKVN